MTVRNQQKASILAERAIPYNGDLEIEAIAKVIESPTYIYDAYLSTLKPDDFHAFGPVWEYVLSRARNEEAISLGLISQHLTDIGHESLSENDKNALFGADSGADTESIVSKLKAMTKSRKLIAGLTEASRYAFTNKPNRALNLLKQLRDEVNNIDTNVRRDRSGFVLEDEINSFLFPEESGNKTSIPAFTRDLQSKTGGFPRGVITSILARPSMGKALRNDQRVLTNNGWKEIEFVRVGDRVFGSDGKTHEVLGVYPQGKKEMYAVLFDDGTRVYCCKDHIWTFEKSGNKKLFTTDTVEMKRISELRGRQVYLPESPVIRYQNKDFDSDAIYMLGAFVGSGRFRSPEAHALVQKKGVVISSWRQEVSKNIARIARAYGGEMGIINAPRYQIKYNNITIAESEFTRLLATFPHNNIGNCKRSILETAQRFSIDQRYMFLRGLIDCAGLWDRSGAINIRFHFSGTINPKISSLVTDLIRSLGYKVMKGKAGNDVTISQAWSLDEDECKDVEFAYPDPEYVGPQRLYRYADDLKAKNIEYVKARAPQHKRDIKKSWPYKKRVVAVEKAGTAECTCIAVNALDKLFVTEGYSLTHNTRFMLSTAIYAAIWAEVNYPGEYFVEYFSQDGAPRSIIGGYVLSRYGITVKQWNNKRDTIAGIVKQNISKDIKAITALPIVWNDDSRMSPIEMQSKIHENTDHLKRRPLLVLADYLQNYHPNMGAKYSGRTERTSLTMEQLYEMVRQDDEYAFIVATQLSRELEKRENKRPTMGDGKGASEIEEKSEMILGLYRDSYYTKREDNKGEILVLKDKTGEKDETVNMQFKNGLWLPNYTGGWSEYVDNAPRDILRIQDGSWNATPAIKVTGDDEDELG